MARSFILSPFMGETRCVAPPELESYFELGSTNISPLRGFGRAPEALLELFDARRRIFAISDGV